MSKIQDLIDLKLMYPNGEEIYDLDDMAGYTDSYGARTYDLLKQGITITLRTDDDRDPGIDNGYGERSVTVDFNGTLFKSHRYSGSYGREEWTDWREVRPITVIRYNYVESTY